MNEALDRYEHPIKPMDEKLIGTGDVEICQAQNRNYCLAEGFRRMAKESNVWSVMLRYQAHAERMYRRAIEDFDRLKELRGERTASHPDCGSKRSADAMPNEPNIGTEPEQKEELPPLEDFNPHCRRSPENQPAAVPPATTPARKPENSPLPAAMEPAA